MNAVYKNVELESLSVQQMLTFCGVYELRGYSEAEQSLGLAGPTLWEQVKTPERIYGTKLFERIGRNIRPTVAGTALYKVLRPLVAAIDSTVDVLTEATSSKPSQLTLVTGVRMMLEELAPRIRRFADKHPDVRLRLMSADQRSAQHTVLNNEADLALFIEPPSELVQQGLTIERLYPIDFIAVFPPRHRLIKRARVTVADLLDEKVVVGNSNTIGRRFLDHATFRVGRREPLRIVAETDNSAVTIACVRSGLGIGIIAGQTDGQLTKGLVTKSLVEEIGQVQVVVAYRTGRILPTIARSMIEHLSQTK